MIKNLKSVTSHDLDSPVTNCHTFLDPLPPLERDVLYGRPSCMYVWMYECPFPNTCLGGMSGGNVLLKTGGGIVLVHELSGGIVLPSETPNIYSCSSTVVLT